MLLILQTFLLLKLLKVDLKSLKVHSITLKNWRKKTYIRFPISLPSFFSWKYYLSGFHIGIFFCSQVMPLPKIAKKRTWKSCNAIHSNSSHHHQVTIVRKNLPHCGKKVKIKNGGNVDGLRKIRAIDSRNLELTTEQRRAPISCWQERRNLTLNTNDWQPQLVQEPRWQCCL